MGKSHLFESHLRFVTTSAESLVILAELIDNCKKIRNYWKLETFSDTVNSSMNILTLKCYILSLVSFYRSILKVDI